jgi:hypothetical protein
LSFWSSYERISVQSTKVIVMEYVGEHIKDLVEFLPVHGKCRDGWLKRLIGWLCMYMKTRKEKRQKQDIMMNIHKFTRVLIS